MFYKMRIIDIINNCKSHNKNFQDDWNKKSLEYIDEKIKNNTKYIDLKLSLFNNGVHYEDIKQGNIGNCYLLAAISALTRYPEKIKNFFNLDGIEYGIIGVWFNYESKKNLVIIDKYLPCINRNPIFSYSFSESWIMYIEKAWAKLHGSYC